MYLWEGSFLPFCYLFWFNYWPFSLSSRKGVCYFPLWFSFECIYVQRALYVFLLQMNANLFMNIRIKNSSAGCTISSFLLPGLFFFPKGNSERMIAHHISIISSKVRIKRSWIIKNRLEETSTCHLISFPLLCLSSVNSTNVFLHWCFFDLSVENPQSPEFICSSRAPLPLPFLLVSPNV